MYKNSVVILFNNLTVRLTYSLTCLTAVKYG